jgi:hypothetical protein
LTFLTTVTLESSNSALPDDGDSTEIVGAVLMLILILLLKQFSCASIGNKTLIISRWTVGQ